MKLSNKFLIDLRSASASQLPGKFNCEVEMLLPGGCTSTLGSTSCSCGAVSNVK